MKIISYFTRNTQYEKEAEKFVVSLDKLNIPYFVEGILSLGNWSKNTNFKPTFIREKLNQFKCPVLWIDVDAIVHSHPIFFNSVKCDISYYMRPHRKEILSGTLYFNYSIQAFALIDKWIEHITRRPASWDQMNLQSALHEMKKNISVQIMPPEYCCIFDLMRKNNECKNSPVIEHFQASRKYKNKQ